MNASLYQQHGRFLHAGELTRGPWDAAAQHGGPPAAILMRAFEALDPTQPGGPTLAATWPPKSPLDHGGSDLQITRVTYELLRPVPLGDLRVETSVIRPGRRVQLLQGAISTPEGVDVVRALALRIARAPVAAGPRDTLPGSARGGHVAARVSSEGSPAAPFDLSATQPFLADWSPMFAGDGIEVRFEAGALRQIGPATAWFRLRVPLLEGEEPSPLQRLVAAADFANGIASELDWSEFVFINPDLTVYVEREPRGEWICVDAQMRVTEGGGAVSEGVLYDLDGRVGRALQSLYVARR